MTIVEAWDKVLSSNINIYLASAIDNSIMIDLISQLLKDRGNIVSEWHYTVGTKVNRYEVDIVNGVLKSDLVIAFYPYGDSGTLQEMAIAITKHIPVIYVVPEYVEYKPLICDSFWSYTEFMKFIKTNIMFNTWNGGVFCYNSKQLLDILSQRKVNEA